MSTILYNRGDAYSNAPDKMTIFQECMKQFNKSPVDAKKCRQLLSQLLRLIYSGETYPANESTSLFFSISKLFQHKDASLRQIVYLAIKELSRTSSDVLMVTSSIMKDIQSGDIIYKPNAIRTLSKVLDASTISASERLFRNTLVEKNPVVSSASLISCYNLLPVGKDVIKRFSNETLETIQSNKQFPPDQFELHEYYGANNVSNLPSTSYMYQYHALGLLYHLKNHDKMSLMKLITSLSDGSSLRNSLAVIELIRLIHKILLDDPSFLNALKPLLLNFLKHKSDMVELEACKSLVLLSNSISGYDLTNVINTLQKLLTVPRTATRFGAIRLINKISIKYPKEILLVNHELENLINDSNRSISTLAITTLLKTIGVGTVESESSVGSESVDRLITKMTSLMDEITEDFKIVIIEAIENLALKFQSKHKQLVSFLNDLLRDEGSLALKSSIIDTLFDLIKFLKDQQAKELILMNLCEFIEDCDYYELTVRILYLLGDEGPKTSNPSFYIRHIYNRLVLDNSIVRSSAIISLSKFGVSNDEDVNTNIKILLNRCLNDVDDEVRDRATLSLRFIETNKKQLLVNDTRYDLHYLENKLVSYLNDSDNFTDKFNVNEIPLLTKEELNSQQYETKINRLVKDEEEEQKDESDPNDKSNELLKQQELEQELLSIPELSGFGKLTKSSPTAIYLTEKENEFVVTSYKHLFIESKKLVLQFNITNTVSHLVAQDISVISQPDNELYTEDFILSVDELKPNETGVLYVVFNTPDYDDEDLLAVCAFGNTLSYVNREIIDDDGNFDASDEGWTDEYQIGDLELLPGDFIQPTFNTNFDETFHGLEFENSTICNLKNKTLEQAIEYFKLTLNMLVLDGTEFVQPNANAHVLKLYGKDLWGNKIAILVRLASAAGKLVAKVQIKASSKTAVDLVLDGF